MLRRGACTLLTAVIVCSLGSRPAEAQDCDTARSAFVANAADVQRNLRDLDALRSLESQSPAPGAHSAVAQLASTFTGGSGCSEGESLSASNSNGGLLAQVRGNDERRLQVYALGTFSAFRLENPSASGHTLGGLLGVRGQWTSWLTLGIGRHEVRFAGANADAPGPYYVAEVGIPRLGLLTRILFGAKSDQRFPDLRLGEIPLGGKRLGSVVLRQSLGEERRILTAAVTQPLPTGPGMSLALDAEASAESSPMGLRHAAVRLRNILLDTPRSHTGIGARVSQRAFVSAFRGARMREVSSQEAAYGAGYQVHTEMQSPFGDLGLRFDLEYNAPEVLTLMPQVAGQVALGLRLTYARRW